MQTRPIAIIGLSGRYPGGADTLDQLWANLSAGVDAITDLPADRWDAGYGHPAKNRAGRSYTYASGYIKNVADFDADFFGISPREAQQMDPQHRLLLELAWEALENAHLVPGALAGSRTGVYVGLSSRDYGDFSGDTSINAYTNIGLSLSLASNRISYTLDLKGPSFTVDTACSSGMVALHQARMAILAGECDMAMVGAANLLLSPKPYIGFSKASMLSPAGRCTSFDADGAGYVRAEGGGMLVLKGLAEAERDGDTILGVLLASGVNSDGRTMGIALPNVDAQEALLRQVYADAGIHPDQVFYLEAHGTGTAVGDPIECEAIARVLGGAQRGAQPLRIGSIKSNIGHLEPAAGIAGLTKVLLALKHRQLPANLHFKTPNPKIDFAGWKLQVVDQATPLPETDTPLVLGVNSFGFGGTNGHAVLQEYRAPVRAAVAPVAAQDITSDWSDQLVLSGQSPAALDAVVAQWTALLQAAADQARTSTAASAHTAWQALRGTALHHRTHHAHRLVLRAASAAEALQRLQQHVAHQAHQAHQADQAQQAQQAPADDNASPAPVTTAPTCLAVGKAPASGAARTAWVYGGNGPQWWGMGRALLASDSTYRSAVQAVDTIFQSIAGWSLITELQRDAQTSRMALTEVAQPTLFALQVGLTAVLRQAGLAPDVVYGHSVGEVAAAWASGALSLPQATLVIAQRSAAQATTAGLGKMAALGIPPAQAQALIDEIGGFLELAAVNAPGAVTVAGDPAQLDILVQRVTEAGSFARLLALDYAFHTRAMDGIRQRLHDSLDGLAPGACTVPFLSTVEGKQIDGSALGADYWWRNVREPVAFQAATDEALGTHQITGFIEVGPHPVLRDYLLQCAKARNIPVTALATLRRPRGEQAEPDADTLWLSVCAAQAAGFGQPQRLLPRPLQPVALPAYPWQRSRHWRGEYSLPELRAPIRRDHPLLGWRTSSTAPVWENLADTFLLPYLQDHQIESAVVFPGAGYIEMALAAASQLLGDGPAQVEDVDFLKPMVITDAGPPVLQLRADTADGSFEISSRAALEGADATLHSRGRITHAEPSHQPAAIAIDALWNSLPVEVDAATHYAQSTRRGLNYGPGFQSVTVMRLNKGLGSDDDSLHGAAWITLPGMTNPVAGMDLATSLPSYRSHPSLLDGCLQTLITLLGHHEARPCAYIPVRVDRLRCFAPLPATVFCTVSVGRQSERSGTAAFHIYDAQGTCLMALDNTRFQKVDFASAAGAAGAPMRLVDHWRRALSVAQVAAPGAAGQPAELPIALPIQLPDPQTLAQALQPCDTPDDNANSRLDALAGLYAADALRALWAIAGLDLGATCSPGALQRRARVAGEHAPLFKALLQMALADGWLVDSPQGLQWPTTARPAAAAAWLDAARALPAHSAELLLLAEVGEQLPALLRGEAAPAQAVAAERGNPALEALFDTAPYRAGVFQRSAQALRALVASWPADRPLRVLELHAGGGGLTAAVLAQLPVLRSDYVLTDPSDAAVERLAQRHAQATQLSARVLRLDDAASLAPLQGAFDLVLCGDGLAASSLAPDAALARVRNLLVPGGWLMLAADAPGRLPSLLLGQDPAWWRQASCPLLDAAAWSALWQNGGWTAAAPLASGNGAQGVSLRTSPGLWLAARDREIAAADAAGTPVEQTPTPAALPQHWLLLSDTTDSGQAFASQLAEALRSSGQTVRCQALHVPGSDSLTGAAPSTAVDDTAAFGRWLQSPLDRVVQLAGLTSRAASAESQLLLQQLRCMPVASLLQAMKAEGADIASRATPKLRVLTRLAFAGPAGSANIQPAQVPVWGLARVLSNEHAELAPKMIDLHAPLDLGMATRVATELLRDDGETEVLLDNTGRWLHRLIPASLASLAQQADSLAQTNAVGRQAAEPGQAVRLQAAAQGGLDALHLRALPRRAPAAGEVEVAVRAAGLNFRDVLWAMNMLPEEAVEAGFSGATVGMECAGQVVAVGAGVQHLAVGDRVIGFASGCFASHVTTAAGAMAAMPAGMDWAAAATIPTTFLTAMYALDHLARLAPGERVLIHGAAGGVGLAAVQIAKLRGAVVFGTAGSPAKRRLLRLMGVDHVLDSRSLAYADDVLALTQGQGVDVVLNSLAGEAITKNLQILRPFGRMLEIGKRDFYANSRIGLRPFRQNLSYFGIDADTLLIERPDLAHQVFAQVVALFADGKLHPLPHQALPIQRAAQAFRLMQQSRHVGKIVITLPAAAASDGAAAETALPDHGQAAPPALRGLGAAWQAGHGNSGGTAGTWLVSGGLGGFGLATARWLVARGARHLALLSRRGASSDEAQAGIAAMQAAGATVRPFVADVSSSADLARVLAEVRITMPPLVGVLHSAMVLDDGPVLTLNGERLHNVLAPKLVGAWHLHQLTQGDALREFIVYSSATTVVGNPGQGNYVAANLYLESLVQLRRAQGRPGLAIAWGAIKDVGVLTRHSGLDVLVAQRSGIAATPADQALAELGQMLGAGAAVVSVAQFNVQRLGDLLAATRTPRFAALAPQGGLDSAGAVRQSLAERMPGTAAADRRPLVTDTLREHLGRILGTAAGKIDLERPLPELGLDSLMAVELAQSLEKEVGRTVSVMQMIQASSAMAVADMLLQGFEAPAHV